MWTVKDNDIYCDKCNTRLHTIIQGLSKTEHVCDCGETFLYQDKYWTIRGMALVSQEQKDMEQLVDVFSDFLQKSKNTKNFVKQLMKNDINVQKAFSNICLDWFYEVSKIQSNDENKDMVDAGKHICKLVNDELIFIPKYERI